MEKHPASKQYPEIPDINPWVGSPEHFEQAKNNADTTDGWDSLEEWRNAHGPAPWNDPRWQTPPDNSEITRMEHATDALRNYVAEDTPTVPPQTATRKQLDPAIVGMVTATAFMAVQLLGIGDSPSDFVLNHPEAATTMLAIGAAATGAIAGKLTNDLNLQEKLDTAKHLKKDERNNQ